MTLHSLQRAQLGAHLRAIAASLLQATLKIAPPYATDWGRAMLGELHHVEGDWSALAWSIGSAGILAKHALFAALVPGSLNQTHANAGSFFAKEKPMRKSSLITAAACLAASLFFFLAPTFKQAFRVSLTQWPAVMDAIRGRYTNYGPDFSKLEKQARQRNDAEALAFIALHEYPPAGAPLADEAVRMDPKLTWIYAAIGIRGWSYPQRAAWVPKLKELDPQNAVPYLIEALEISQALRAGERYPFDEYLRDPKWLNAMAAAFASPKIDTYNDRRKDLDRTIALRYGSDYNFEDPYLAQSEFRSGPLINLFDPMSYAKLLVASGDALAARGDVQGAQKQYWTVIHFGEMWQPSGSVLAQVMLQQPYKRMASLYQKQGDANQARLFTFLSSSAELARQQDRDASRTLWANDSLERWNANILQLSGIIVVLCVCTLFICAIVTVARSRTIHLAKLRAGAGTSFFAMSSAVGLFLSSATLYLTYRPYDAIVRAFVQDGEQTRMQTLEMFLYHAESPLGYGTLYKDAGIVFWTGLIALCAVALIVATAKYFWQTRRAPATA